jgi:hypothetical protein
MGAAIFLFAFPKGSISTLMHEVLHLPGPGAGIVLILGPFVIILTLLSYLVVRRNGSAVATSLAFAVAYALLSSLLKVAGNPKGAFGSACFVAAIALLGIAVETVMTLGTALNPMWRCLISGSVANAVLCIVYWVVIFPSTTGWVRLGDVPVLMGLCLLAGIASGCVACKMSNPISRALALKQQE